MSHRNALSAPPRATYRLQFGRDFRFDDARRIVPYLAALGVSHVYASPLLMARPGSLHGYDIVDHNRLNPEIGGPADFDAFVDELHRLDMGLILDFVPNHMGIGADNPWWVDVLEWGRVSPYADFFDIDWEPLEPSLAGKVLLPVLADHYGAVLARGELQLRLNAEQGTFTVIYFDHTFPIAPHDYPELLQTAAARRGGTAHPFDAFATDLRASFEESGEIAVQRRRVAELKQRLADVLVREPEAKRAIEEALAALNGRPGKPETFDALHRMLERQAYRLAFWRVAAFEINYRRFFDINDLAGLRMEQPELFEITHRLVRRLIAEGKIQGLRLDHVDGLREPKAYFARLQRLVWSAGQPLTSERTGTSLRENRKQEHKPAFYVVVEKILARHEHLRRDWAISGTTGYDFMSAVNGLFVDPAGQRRLTHLYERWVGRTVDFEDLVVDAKLQIIHETLASELNILANLFNRLAKENRDTRDFTRTGLREALANIVAHFPVYRTYVTATGASGADQRDIDWAIGKARRSARTPDRSVYDFIHAVLTLDLQKTGHSRRDILDAALEFQQYTGPVMAKAVEDTAFYRYVRLMSLNEVGGEPGHFGTRPNAFHQANRRRLREHPFSMVTTATHDHKRGEDVRARLDVLSEMPRAWTRHARRWAELNARKRRELEGHPAPSRSDEYLFYQTVAGAWPLDLAAPDFEDIEAYKERIDAYLRKAAREAKQRTSWAAPDEAYESALSDFVARTLDTKQSRPFLEDMVALVEHIAVVGAVNGLAQVLLKLVSPGVPDTYQGTEYWDFSLVDPDNRRPVDYEVRQESLRALKSMSCNSLLTSWRDGRIKQHVIRCALDVRRRQPALFTAGNYRPVVATGPHANRLLAIARTYKEQTLVAVVPRLVRPLLESQALPLPRGWGTTALHLPDDVPHGELFFDAMSGGKFAVPPDGKLDVDRLLVEFPVALLVSDRLEDGGHPV